MIEMRKGHSLDYSNQIPGWAKIAHLVIFFFLALRSLGGFGLAAICCGRVCGAARCCPCLYLVLLMVNLLIAVLWMPNWEVTEDVFTENSPSFTFILIISVALFIFGRYWRATRCWFRPVVDTLLIYAVQAAGLAVSGLFRKSTAMYYEAAWIDTLTVGVFICISFAAAQLAARVRKARRTRDDWHSAGG